MQRSARTGSGGLPAAKSNAMLTVAALLLALLATPASAQVAGRDAGPFGVGPMDHNIEIDALHRAAVARARRLGLDRVPPRALPSPILEYPLRLRPHAKAPRGEAISNFVDLDPTANLKEFTCGMRTYNGHRGIDYFLWPYSWVMMDEQEVEIVAAAPGAITGKNDGQFDRQCSLNNQEANYVIVRQDDGVFAYYWHMKKGSVTTKPIGSRVAMGDYLGLVGSSGNSTGPHLHLEFRTVAGLTVDPYAGACGEAKTSWRHQHEDAHTAILRVATQRGAPNTGNKQCGQNFPPGYSDRFKPGSTVWVVAYVRDMRPDTPIQFTVLRPDGTTYGTWTSGTPPSVYSATYSYVVINVPTTGSRGPWTARVTLDGKTAEHVFFVGGMPKRTKLASRVKPDQASATRRDPAKFKVTVRNKGTTEAVGCTLAPDVPLAAGWQFREKGQAGWNNAAFDIPPGGRKVILLSILPKRGYTADEIAVPIRVFCTNADAPAAKEGVNIVTLSF